MIRDGNSDTREEEGGGGGAFPGNGAIGMGLASGANIWKVRFTSGRVPPSSSDLFTGGNEKEISIRGSWKGEDFNEEDEDEDDDGTDEDIDQRNRIFVTMSIKQVIQLYVSKISSLNVIMIGKIIRCIHLFHFQFL